MVVEIFERWNGGQREFDPSLFAEGIEIRSAMTNATYAGEEGLRRWVGEIDEQFSVWSLEVDAFDEPREGVVVAKGHIRGEGRGSGAPFEQPASWLVEVEGGQVASLQTFLGQDEAARQLERER